MSIEVSTKVWKLDLPQPLKLLALALADWADDDGNDVRPSIGYVAWKVGASVRTVQRQMRTLETLGIVEVVDKRGYRLKSGQWVPLLAIHPEKGQPLPDWASQRGDNLTPLEVRRDDSPKSEGVTTPRKRGDKTLSPNTSGNTSVIPTDFQIEEVEPLLPGESQWERARRIALDI